MTKRFTLAGMLLALCLLSAFVGALAAAQIVADDPGLHTFVYRGYLENGDGPIDGAADLSFQIYDAQVDGSPIGDAIARPDTVVNRGHFSVELEVPASALGQSGPWIEIVVDNGDPLQPRQRLVSQPFAANGAPAGSIVAFGGGSVPAGWLRCDGSAVRSSDYPSLHAAIGSSWGNGSGGTGAGVGTDFNVPDLRGRFLRGADLEAGRDPDRDGREPSSLGGNEGDHVGTVQAAATALPEQSFTTSTAGAHSHCINVAGADDLNFSGNFDGVTDSDAPNNRGCVRNTNVEGAHTHAVDSGGDAETRPENASVQWIIKY